MTSKPATGLAMVETAIGAIGLAWNMTAVSQLLLPEPVSHATRARMLRQHGDAVPWFNLDRDISVPSFVIKLADDLVHYAQGARVDFSAVPVDFGGADPFRLAVYGSARALAYGDTTTYGCLAEAAGHPGAARETGVALGRNPVPIVMPCHRVVAAGGKLGGFSAPGGALTKQKLLAMEQARPVASRSTQASFAF